MIQWFAVCAQQDMQGATPSPDISPKIPLTNITAHYAFAGHGLMGKPLHVEPYAPGMRGLTGVGIRAVVGHAQQPRAVVLEFQSSGVILECAAVDAVRPSACLVDKLIDDPVEVVPLQPPIIAETNRIHAVLFAVMGPDVGSQNHLRRNPRRQVPDVGPTQVVGT
jgi:hypothetical protein